jgi:hypothetical protein
MRTSPKPVGGEVMVTIVDGTRQPFGSEPNSILPNILITVTDGNNHAVSRKFHKLANVLFDQLPIFGNAGDNYTFLAFQKGYKQAGFFPVHISPGVLQSVGLMLIPESNTFNFASAKWNRLDARPKLKALFGAGAENDLAAATRYSNLEDAQSGAILACLLNITTACDQMFLQQGTALDYFQQVAWDHAGPFSMAQDRFYAWADRKLIHQLDVAKSQKTFVDAPFVLHPGATRSYKQIQFGEANVQLTFHENEPPPNSDWVLVEPDIDYFRDPLAHVLLEVAVNAFGSLTDPRTVYALRWIAGNRSGIPEFDPLYTIVEA